MEECKFVNVDTFRHSVVHFNHYDHGQWLFSAVDSNSNPRLELDDDDLPMGETLKVSPPSSGW